MLAIRVGSRFAGSKLVAVYLVILPQLWRDHAWSHRFDMLTLTSLTHWHCRWSAGSSGSCFAGRGESGFSSSSGTVLTGSTLVGVDVAVLILENMHALWAGKKFWIWIRWEYAGSSGSSLTGTSSHPFYILTLNYLTIWPQWKQGAISVSNGSGLPFRVSVWVTTKLSENTLPGWSIRPKCQFGSGSKDSFERVHIGQIFTGLPRGSVCTFL
jgi:hypothetical protein